MTMRNLSPSTHETYIRAVAQFSAFHRRSPDKLGVEHLREYHLHLVSRGLAANSICVKMSALRFFYGTTLRRPDIAGRISMPRRTDHLPTVLAREEVEHLLNAVPDLKQRTALITIYLYMAEEVTAPPELPTEPPELRGRLGKSRRRATSAEPFHGGFSAFGNCLKKQREKHETGIFSIKTGRAIKPERAITERN